MDQLDLRALIYLTDNGRAAWSELASRLGLSAPSCAERVRKLEDRGIITGYTALINASKIGLSLTAFLEVTLERPQARAKFLEMVESHPSVIECHHITGDFDYLLKVRTAGTPELEELLSELKTDIGVLKTRTTIVLSSPKETTNASLKQFEKTSSNNATDVRAKRKSNNR